MSGVGIVRYKLANAAALTAVVPAVRIIAGAVPVNTTIPAIGVTQVSSVQRNIVGMNAASYQVTERVQVTVYAKTYATQKSILALVRAALPQTRGTVNTFVCDSILVDSEGPDIYDDVATIYEQSQDFVVKYAR